MVYLLNESLDLKIILPLERSHRVVNLSVLAQTPPPKVPNNFWPKLSQPLRSSWVYMYTALISAEEFGPKVGFFS